MPIQFKIAQWFSERRGWWFKIPPEGKSDGLLESLELFEKFLDSNGPFDGIIGFSQGAAFLALACILLEEKCKYHHFLRCKVILFTRITIGGKLPIELQHVPNYVDIDSDNF